MKLVSFAQVRTNSISIIITSIDIELLLALHSYPGILTRSHTAIRLHISCLVVITMMMKESIIWICRVPVMVQGLLFSYGLVAEQTLRLLRKALK